MNHETNCHRTDVECRESGEAIVLASHIEPSAFDVQRSLFDVPPCQPFDELKASQARAALIAFTKTFFALDDDCALPCDI